MSKDKSKKNKLPHKINVEHELSNEVYKERLERDEQLYNNRGLLRQREIPIGEVEQIKGVASFLNQLHGEAVIEHPRNGYLLSVNANISPYVVYMLSCGDYSQRFIEAIEDTITPQDKVIDIGAGIGISSLVASLLSEKEVVAIEPNKKLHEIIKKNVSKNGGKVSVVDGAISPILKSGDELDLSSNQNDIWGALVSSDKNIDDKNEEFVASVLNLEEIVKKSKANALLVDIQGSETEELINIIPKSIDKLIINIYSQIIGEEATADLINALSNRDFSLTSIKGRVFVFKR